MVNGAKRVLVFDSGVGGLSVFDAITAAGFGFELDYACDNAWLPYGLKSDEQLRARVPALLARLAEQWTPEAVVVACNTASTIALEQVRAALTIPVVGVVPPVKPAAAMTQTGVIGLLATPATVQRAYTDDLVARFADGKRVIRFGSSALVEAAERKLRGEDPGQSAIAEAVEGLFSAPGGNEIDVVALACTHFPLLAVELAAAAPRQCLWMDSGAAIARRLAHVLDAEQGASRVQRAAFTSGDSARASLRAFEMRGFSDFSHISATPSFEVAPLIDASSA